MDNPTQGGDGTPGGENGTPGESGTPRHLTPIGQRPRSGWSELTVERSEVEQILKYLIHALTHLARHGRN
jgi:hypothetical protein